MLETNNNIYLNVFSCVREINSIAVRLQTPLRRVSHDKELVKW